MAFTQNTLSIHVYAPALMDDDRRHVAVVHAMERATPGLRLEWTVSDEHELLPLPQRDTWLAQARRNGGFPLVCNNDRSHPVTIFGVAESASFGPGGQALLEVHAELPLEESGLAAVADILEGIAEGARAFWGHATPFEASVEISRQTRDPVRKPGVSPRGLPALKLPEQIPAPEIPHRLGWLNYWSPATAEAIGFPDPARDTELLSRARRTATGAWVVQLTDAPLDLDNPAQLDALKRAYDRFPEIGGRAAP
ncbi:DUF5953 family protein [Archangium primigenium]|uniref:DUF5953 family protein n=1 Tax=[Archangium] primigenium TaxID=2792470 RepID=UPI00195E0109|nr:DUF5953 family protein [Archangium primigenium]MBM7116287.1 hypothetical protein [Archangium primigenium]